MKTVKKKITVEKMKDANKTQVIVKSPWSCVIWAIKATNETIDKRAERRIRLNARLKSSSTNLSTILLNNVFEFIPYHFITLSKQNKLF